MCTVRLLIIKYIHVKVYLKMEITLIIALQNTEMISSKSFLVDRSCVIQPALAPPPPSLLSLSAIFLSQSVCMCHILTPVCRCGPGHRCRCSLSGPIFVLGQIFFACVCMQQPCMCERVSGHVKLQLAWSNCTEWYVVGPARCFPAPAFIFACCFVSVKCVYERR